MSDRVRVDWPDWGGDKEGEVQGTCTGVEDVEAADYPSRGRHVRG